MFGGFSKHMWLLETAKKRPLAGIQRIYSLSLPPPAPSSTIFAYPGVNQKSQHP